MITPVTQIPMKDERKTGYKFGQKLASKNNTFHPGSDLNSGNTGYADEGLPIKPWAEGVVVYSKDTKSGWGNLIIIEHPQFANFSPNGYVASRYAHFKATNVKVGDKVTLNTIIGFCGRTGTDSPHCHWEIMKTQLPRPTFYPNGEGLEFVLQNWFDPYEITETINKLYMNDPIIDWHKKNKIIEHWSVPAIPEEIKLGYAIYKGLKAFKENPNIDFNL